jgi:hypothetical protein
VRGGLTALVAGFALALLTVGCGGGESTVAERPATTAAPVEAPPPERGISQVETRRGLAPNPLRQPARVRRHPGFHVDRVVVRELKKGRGPRVRPHDIVLVDYIEADYRKGIIYNDGWGAPPLGTAGVILAPIQRWRGLVIGMKGMQPGGHRRILVPPRLAGIEPGHMEYGTVVLWDVVLRKILARGCSNEGQDCRSIAP